MPAPLVTRRIAEADDGQRLDRWLKKAFPAVPFVGFQKMLRQGKVRINGHKADGAARLAAGDEISLPPHTGDNPTLPPRATRAPVYQVTEADMALLESMIVYEDKALLVLNKPAGLPAQAGGGQVKSLDRLLEGAYGADKAPKLTHRLDKETTGLIVCAKNRTNAAAMADVFADKTARAAQGQTGEVEKTYLALVWGRLPAEHGDVRGAILKEGPFARVDSQGDFAHTSWRLVRSFEQGGEPFHVLACVPHTGRMNQIRVHMAHIGLPLVGDDKYGSAALKKAGKVLHPTGQIPLYLHAWKLVFPHPQNGEKMALSAPFPPHFAALLGTSVEGVASL